MVGIGSPRELKNADPIHLGHPLVRAAIDEARVSTQGRFCVVWDLDQSSPPQLKVHKGRRGRLVLTRLRYEGFERVDRLVPTTVLEGEATPLEIECAHWLLDHPPHDRPALVPPLELENVLEDAVEEQVFLDQAEVAAHEQQRFERNLEQIERYVEDQLLVVRRRLGVASVALRAAEDKRDAALGSEARGQAEKRIQTLQEEIDEMEAEIRRLQIRDDPDYDRWREYAHQRRFRPPEATRILDVEFVLE